ncbi:hypothetical protein IW136_005360 [Coemansia sp. RSA 678]|nr:hypothetical protein IW136_005360 [Coemansia sp. RSA 678]
MLALFAARPTRTLCRTFASHATPRRENIGVLKAYGKPVATIFLWSALTYMSFQAVWNTLYFDEIKLETEAKIDDLQAELKRLEH